MLLWRLLLVLALQLLALQVAPGVAQARDGRVDGLDRSPAPSCPEPTGQTQIARIEEDGSLRLGDDMLLVPAGIVALEMGSGAQGSAGTLSRRLREELTGKRLLVSDPGSPDRWGRRPVHVWLEGDPLVLLAGRLVRQGLARVAVEDLAPDCALYLLEQEERARQEKAGFWPGHSAGPVAARDSEALAAAEGRFVLAEGVVISRGDGRDRIWLNFGPAGSKALAVTIRKRSLNRMPDWGKRIETLVGRRIRIRGIVQPGRQPAIEVVVPAQIELLDKGRRVWDAGQ